MKKEVNAQQACLIIHALGHALETYGVEIPQHLKEVYRVTAEDNPTDGDLIDNIDIMEMLADLVKDEYSYHFNEEIELED